MAQSGGYQKTKRTGKCLVLAFLLCLLLLFLLQVACDQPGGERDLSKTGRVPGQAENRPSPPAGQAAGWWRADSIGAIIAALIALASVIFQQLQGKRFKPEDPRLRERFEIYSTLSGRRFALQQLERAVVEAQLSQRRASAMSALRRAHTAHYLNESTHWGLETSRLLVIASRARERIHEALAKAQVHFDLTPEVLAEIESVRNAAPFDAGINPKDMKSSADVLSWYNKKAGKVEGWVTSKFEAPLSAIVAHLAEQVESDRLESSKRKGVKPWKHKAEEYVETKKPKRPIPTHPPFPSSVAYLALCVAMLFGALLISTKLDSEKGKQLSGLYEMEKHATEVGDVRLARATARGTARTRALLRYYSGAIDFSVVLCALAGSVGMLAGLLRILLGPPPRSRREVQLRRIMLIALACQIGALSIAAMLGLVWFG